MFSVKKGFVCHILTPSTYHNKFKKERKLHTIVYYINMRDTVWCINETDTRNILYPICKIP